MRGNGERGSWIGCNLPVVAGVPIEFDGRNVPWFHVQENGSDVQLESNLVYFAQHGRGDP